MNVSGPGEPFDDAGLWRLANGEEVIAVKPGDDRWRDVLKGIRGGDQ